MANRQRDEHNVIQKYYVICQLFWELHWIIDCNLIENFALISSNELICYLYIS